MHKKRNLRWLALCCGLLIFFSACGTDDGKRAEAGSASSSSSPESDAQTLLESAFTIQGIDYFAGMDVVTEESQHQLSMEGITLEESRLDCRVEITREGMEPEEVSFSGDLYRSEVPYNRERGGVVCIVDSITPGWAVNLVYFIQEAGEEDLFTAHEAYAGKPMARFVLHPEEYDGKTLYFEGTLPEDFPVDRLIAAALTARENGTEADGENSQVVEKDRIYWEEYWYSRYTDDDVPFYDMDLPENQ